MVVVKGREAAKKAARNNAVVELIKILCCLIKTKASLKPKAEPESADAVVLHAAKECSRSSKG
jgi:hypothetical protein